MNHLLHFELWTRLVAWGWCAFIIAWPRSMHAQLSLSDSSQPSEQVSVALGENMHAVSEATTVAPNDALVALGRNDASLNDLAFVSEDRMAAVGDRGMILVSNNSGRTWETAECLTTANLLGIQFSPLGFGLIVGGWIGGDTRSSHAVVLQTLDGGKKWTVIPTPELPRLTGLRIRHDRCIAWGDYSPTWRTSLFESVDGGLTWRGIPTSLGHATAAGIADSGQIAAVDQLGRAYLGNSNSSASVATRETTPKQLTTPDSPVHCLHHTGQRWLACGAEGELIWSTDGLQWIDVDLPLSPAARELCQWRAMEQVGEQLWVCGKPGSIVLHSKDRGVSWSVQRTGQSLPLSAVRFVDSNRGWATGPLGLILATRDGGQSWYAQRQMASRLGLLSVSTSVNEIPWAAMVAAAWDEQVATATSVLQSPEPIDQAGFTPTNVCIQMSAASQVGLCSCESTRQPILSPEHLIRQLSLEVLCWRPDVVLVNESAAQPNSTPNDPNQVLSIIHQAQTVLQRCAAPIPILTEELQLVPWSVSKLVQTCQSEHGQFNEQSSRVLRRPGIAIADCLFPLSTADRLKAARLSMRTIWSSSQSRSAYTSLLGAIAPTPETDRQVAIRNVGNYQLIMGRAARAQSILGLAQIPTVDSSLEQWSNDLDFVLSAVPAREKAILLKQLSHQLNLASHWDKRRVVYERLIDGCPDGEAADWGRLELLRLERSQERAAWEQNTIQSSTPALRLADGAAQPHPVAGVELANRVESWNASPFGATDAYQQPSRDRSVVVAAAVELPLEGARLESQANKNSVTAWRHFLQRLGKTSPAMLMRPDIQLLLFSNGRTLQSDLPGLKPGVSQLDHLHHARQLVGWSQMAEQELALATNHTSHLRWKTEATAASQPPLLDGQLDDACWNGSPAMLLTTLNDAQAAAAPQPDTILRWSYDRDYLYVCISSPHQPGFAAPNVVQQRGYDADLSDVDHVHLLFDTDRDYCTAVELAIAADGRTYDRCSGAAQYNPKWHVCVQTNANNWTAEMAIALNELTTRTNVAGEAWAVSARRLHPTGTSQSWSQLRSHSPYLHASGLLIFRP